MTALSRRRPPVAVGLAAGIAFAGVIAIFAGQYLRAGWPFARPPPQAHVRQAPQPAPMESHDSHASHASHGAGVPVAPPGYAAVTVDPARAAALQLTTATVEEREFRRVVRTVGVVTLDETRTAHVHSKIRGWIDAVHVDFTGRKVSAGEPLCSIYSQEVYSAEMELVSILGSAPGQDALLEAARRRLALWDVPRSEIDRLEATREPLRAFPLLAPRAGTVIAKQALQGTFVDPSVELYTLSDLSRVWVLADVYEADVPYVRVGARARLTIEGQAVPLEAPVAFLSPTLDEATRTRKARFELPNPGGKYLPGAFASVELELPMGKGLAIPESAVIRTGTRSIAFVAHGDPAEHLEPRELKLGPLVGDRYQVESGVSAGERVATGAQFLRDSASRLQASGGQGAGHVH